MRRRRRSGRCSRRGNREDGADAPRQDRSADRTYLITGGLGGLGLEVAGWLAAQGARHLALNARHAPGVEAEAVLDALRRSGVQAEVLLGDVAQEEEVRGMLAEIDGTLPPLAGVIHSVGVLRDGALVNQNWPRFAEVMAPKVLGAWHLHRLTAGRDLELFVLFSSSVSLLGNRGQGNHAAANAFLDQLARERRAAGLPGVVINWGAWSGRGAAAAARPELGPGLQKVGLGLDQSGAGAGSAGAGPGGWGGAGGRGAGRLGGVRPAVRLRCASDCSGTWCRPRRWPVPRPARSPCCGGCGGCRPASGCRCWSSTWARRCSGCCNWQRRRRLGQASPSWAWTR